MKVRFLNIKRGISVWLRRGWGRAKQDFSGDKWFYSSHCREWNIIMVAYLSAVHRCPSGFLSSTCLNQYLSSPHPWNLIFFLNLLPSTLPSCTSVPLIWFLGCLCLLFLMLTYIQSSSSHPSNIPLVIAWSLFLKKSSYLITTSPTTNFYWFPYCIQNNIPRPQPALQKVYLKPSFPFLISFSLLSVSQTVLLVPIAVRVLVLLFISEAVCFSVQLNLHLCHRV